MNAADFGVQKTAFTFGKHSGKAAVNAYFESKGILLSDSECAPLMNMLKNPKSKNNGLVIGEQLIELHKKLKMTEHILSV